jgi:PHD/YefM family antitoxin component YafN of YafNO toxin-antitoxin module
MLKKIKIRKPDFVYRNGKPVSVILNISDYENMLEKLEEMEDLKLLKQIREKPLEFNEIDDVIRGLNLNV